MIKNINIFRTKRPLFHFTHDIFFIFAGVEKLYFYLHNIFKPNDVLMHYNTVKNYMSPSWRNGTASSSRYSCEFDACSWDKIIFSEVIKTLVTRQSAALNPATQHAMPRKLGDENEGKR